MSFEIIFRLLWFRFSPFSEKSLGPLMSHTRTGVSLGVPSGHGRRSTKSTGCRRRTVLGPSTGTTATDHDSSGGPFTPSLDDGLSAFSGATPTCVLCPKTLCVPGPSLGDGRVSPSHVKPGLRPRTCPLPRNPNPFLVGAPGVNRRTPELPPPIQGQVDPYNSNYN